MGSCLDLRKFQDPTAIQDAFSKIVSRKAGYKTVIEKKVEPIRCPNEACRRILEGSEKFCPDCGTRTNFGIK